MSDVEVTQADREAAARWAKSNSRHAQSANILRGSCDTAPIVQAFARHRIATQPTAPAVGDEVEAVAKERAAIVAYIERIGAYGYSRLASDIACGEHHE